MVALHAIPRIPVLLRAAAATIATFVPWSSVASSDRPVESNMSFEADDSRPANSGLSTSMPVSTMAMVTP